MFVTECEVGHLEMWLEDQHYLCWSRYPISRVRMQAVIIVRMFLASVRVNSLPVFFQLLVQL